MARDYHPDFVSLCYTMALFQQNSYEQCKEAAIQRSYNGFIHLPRPEYCQQSKSHGD